MPSKYLSEWKNAKDHFEEETGLKKPSAKGKGLFKSWRKPSGIEDAFKALDKYIDEMDINALDEKVFKKWEKLVTTAKETCSSYMELLKKAIDEEKEKQDEEDERTKTYRQLKLLRASLDSIVSTAEQYYKDQLGVFEDKQKKGGEDLNYIEGVLHTLKMLGTNLKSGIAKGTKFCQVCLSEPTAANWNHINSDQGARSTSQSISNIVKYVYADEVDLLLKGKSREIDILWDEDVAKHIRSLNLYLYEHQAAILEMGKQTGTDAFDASLAKLANSGDVHLPNDASKADVIRAVKRFANMLKVCKEISTQLIRFGT